jgi:hypothetical protein
VLTAVARNADPEQGLSTWSDLASALLITAGSLLAVVSKNLPTLLLAWTGLDLLEMALWLAKARNSEVSKPMLIAFSTRFAGTVLAIWAAVSVYAVGRSLSFEAIPAEISTYLLIAAGLRLGVLPLNSPSADYLPPQRGVRVIFRLAPQAANLAVLVRAASAGASPALSPYLFILAGLAALYAGVSWINSVDEIEGLPFWVLGVSAFALAAATRAEPAAALAWGIALLLPGGLLLLYSTRQPWLLPLLLLGALSISSLPFTPTWQGVLLYKAPYQWLSLPFLAAQSLILAGYVRHALRPAPILAGAERWVWIIYPWGLALLPLAHLSIAWWTRPETSPVWLAAWPAVLAVGLAALISWLGRRGSRSLARLLHSLQNVLAFSWFYRLLSSLLYPIRRLLSIAATILEGDAGILWALLIVILLLSVSLQAGG